MIKLVKLTKEYKAQLDEMMDEWSNANEKIIPWAIRRVDYHDFDAYLPSVEYTDETRPADFTPESTYFCFDGERNIFVGAVNIRHSLNDMLLKTGGHIGDGIRPSERNKGYATKMIKLALEKCKELGIKRVLITCDKLNIASARTIQKNGGVLENEILDDGELVQRYWIDNN